MKNLQEQVSAHPRWSVFLMFVGVVALITAWSNLLSFIGDTGNSLHAESLPSVESEEFFQTVAGVAHSPQINGGTVTILRNGDGFFPVLFDAIKNAKKTINITWYVWQKGELSTQMHDALKDAAERGVNVRILLDGIDGDMPTEERDDLKKAGVVIADFRDPKIGQLSRIHRRDHRRAIVIDGTVGFTGGMAVADYWLGNADNPDHWHDMMIKVTGPLARSVQSAFADLWAGAAGEILTGDDIFPAHIADANTDIHAVHVVSSPFEDTQMLPNFFWLSISAAQRNLYIETPYFVPSPAIIDALKNRAKAGVDVKLILPNDYNDEKLALHAARYHYQDLIAAGVKIYEYQPTMNHEKIIVADGIWTTIGSPNIDFHSMEFNEENVFGFQNKRIAGELTSDFEKDLGSSKLITLEDWGNRSLKEKFLEYVAVHLSKQL